MEHPRARLICIDTWARFKPRPQGRNTPLYDEDYSAIAPLQKLAQANSISIIVIDHMNKREVPNDLHAMLDLVTSSTGKIGGVDGALLLYRKLGEEGARLGVLGRDIEEEQELIITFSPEKVSWIVKGNVEDADIATTPVKQATLDALKDFGEKGATVKELAEKMGKNPHTTRCQLRDLRIESKVQLQNINYSLVGTNHSHQTNYFNQTHRSNHLEQKESPVQEVISPPQGVISQAVSTLITANSHVEGSNKKTDYCDYGDYSLVYTGPYPPPDRPSYCCQSRDWRWHRERNKYICGHCGGG